MSYKNLWSNTAAVFKQSHNNQMMFQDFIQSIVGRIDVEEKYACQLGDLADQLNKYLEQTKQPNAMMIVFSALKSDLTRRASQTITLADHLKTDILIPLQQFYQKQSNKAKKAQNQILEAQQKYQIQVERLKNSKTQLKVSSKIRQQQFIKLQIVKSKFFVNKDDQSNQSTIVRKVEKQYKQVQDTTKATIRQYNQKIVNFYEILNKNLDTFEQQQKARVITLVDNVKKILVFQVSMMRNFEYDITTVSNHLETVKLENQIESFIKKQTKNIPKYQTQSLPPLTLMQSVLLGMIKKTFDQKIKLQNSVKINKMSTDLMKNIIAQNIINQYPDFPQIAKIINQSQKQNLKHQNQIKLNQILQKLQNRIFFELVLRQIVNKPNKHIVTIIQLFVNKKKDVFCLQYVTKLILLNSVSLKQNIIYMSLCKLPLYKNSQFWDANLFQSTQQQLRINQAQKGEGKQECKLRQKKIILKCLQSICCQMILLGYNVQKSKQLALKYCQFYSLAQIDYAKLLKVIDTNLNIFSTIWLKDTVNHNILNSNNIAIKK